MYFKNHLTEIKEKGRMFGYGANMYVKFHNNPRFQGSTGVMVFHGMAINSNIPENIKYDNNHRLPKSWKLCFTADQRKSTANLESNKGKQNSD
jgi:hypothetical protein